MKYIQIIWLNVGLIYLIHLVLTIYIQSLGYKAELTDETVSFYGLVFIVLPLFNFFDVIYNHCFFQF